MKKIIENFLRLARPLSNVKNAALIALAYCFFGVGKSFDVTAVVMAFLSSSFICSSLYAFNSASDFQSDALNENKNHYSKAVSYLGKNTVSIIIIILAGLGFFSALFVNIYFFVCMALLFATGLLYSWKATRLKEVFLLDIVFGAFLTFFLRFAAFWFVFSISLPPLLGLAGVSLAKSAGYLLYKNLDKKYVASGIKNSVTVLGTNAKIILSVVLFTAAGACYVASCLNGIYFSSGILGRLPVNFLWLIAFAIPPLMGMIYLETNKKSAVRVKVLRTAGFIYWIAVIAIVAVFWK